MRGPRGRISHWTISRSFYDISSNDVAWLRAFPVRRKVKSISARIRDKLYGRVSVRLRALNAGLHSVAVRNEPALLSLGCFFLFLLEVCSGFFTLCAFAPVYKSRGRSRNDGASNSQPTHFTRVNRVKIYYPLSLSLLRFIWPLSLLSYFVNHPTNFELATFETFTGPATVDWTETRSDRFFFFGDRIARSLGVK